MDTTDHPNQVLVREHSGLKVELAWLPIMDMAVVTATVGELTHCVTFSEDEKAKAYEAYLHPMACFPEHAVAAFDRIFKGGE